ncbi:MAG: hypothetical protein KDK36_08265, partial [Leptospiraceae bacterium]|nr:hypothetical protein [Leptospiraceae bacterium]
MKHILISLIFYLFIGFQIFAEPIILNEKEFTTGNSFSITWETPEEILHPENYQWKEFTGKKIFKSTSNIPYYIVRYKNKDLTNLKNPALMVRKNGFVLKVYSNKEKIFQYSDNSQFKPGQFTGWPTHIIPISKNNQDEYIYFYLYTKMDVLLPTIVIDEEIKLIENIFLTNLPPFIITGISLFLGLGFLIAFFLRRDDFMYLSLFTFFTGIGIWLFQINPISEYFITPSPWKLRVEYFALYMSPVGALLFIESVLPSRLNVILRTLRYFFLIYTIASFSLDFAGIFPLWKTLIPFDIFLLFSIFIFMILIIYGTIKGKWEARLLTIGLVTLVGFAIHDILVVIGVLQTPD